MENTEAKRIDPKSLRIGNTVLYDEDGKWTPQTVKAIGYNTDGFEGYYLDFGWAKTTIEDHHGDGDIGVKGIPLSENELIRLGFEHENTIGGWSKWSNKKMKLLDMKFYFDSSEYFVRIEYTHQLQNLFYSLTGEELTYKPSES